MNLVTYKRAGWSERDLAMMDLALSLAAEGRRRVSPNPMVGAVLVDGTGSIVARGWHRTPGSPHAEADALAKVGLRASGCTLYVNLEPCNHTGRTGPCTQVIVESGVARVVVGTADPNPLVRGSGIGHLAAAGVQVEVGCREQECRELNVGFARHVLSGFPLVTLKAAVSLDGRMGCAGGDSRWVSSPASRQAVMALRSAHDAIMVGSGTAIADNPALTVRNLAGDCPDAASGDGVPQPVRILLDSRLRVSLDNRIFGAGGGPTMVFCGEEADPEAVEKRRAAGVQVHQVPVFTAPHSDSEEGLSVGTGGVCLERVLTKLGELGLNSVLCEGGGGLFGTFFRCRLGDRLVVFVAPKVVGSDGVPMARFPSPPLMADSVELQNIRWTRFGDDMMIDGLLPWARNPWEVLDQALAGGGGQPGTGQG